jgi:cytochrome oxidase assembly protein ShyY1
MVYSAGSAVREDASTPGTWAFLPARLPSGEAVVIDAGFVENAMQDRSVEDRAVEKLITGQQVMLTGYLRFPESAGLLTPAPSRDKRLWFVRHLAMAKMLGWGQENERVAPFYIDLETPVPQNGIPKPGPLHVHLKDDHLQYAITWFALAFAVAIAFGVWWRRRPSA